MNSPAYKRILLKLSGEALMGNASFGIDPTIMHRLAKDIGELVSAGVEVGVVIGGGNIFRGAGLMQSGINRVTGDHMGMLATVMNSLAMHDFLKRSEVYSRVYSAFPIDQVCDTFNRDHVVQFLQQGGVAMLAAGTGNPFFTTDSAASLRAIEIGADLMIKATKVDGIYSADPVTNPDAVFYDSLEYDQVLRDNLGVMDLNAILLCRDHDLPLRVMNIYQQGALLRLINGENIGTLVQRESGND